MIWISAQTKEAIEVRTQFRCNCLGNHLSAASKTLISTSAKFKDKEKRNLPKECKCYSYHHGDVFITFFSWFSALILFRKNPRSILLSFTVLRLQRRLLLMDFFFIRMRTYEMAGISWILWWLSLGKLFIYLSDSRVCVH